MQLREWHIVISGFMQKSGSLNGMVSLWGDLIQLVAGRANARVELLRWDDNFSNLAELISRLAGDGEPPIVNVYGYSWGGMSAANFARELRRRGIAVNHMVLSDAVYRHWYWLGQWRAFVSLFSIRIPENVRQVTQFRQRESLPMGHRVKADNPSKTRVGKINWLPVDHCWMDDALPFRRACHEAARDAGKDVV